MTATRPSQADHIIRKLGGVYAAARLLGHANPSTVQGWKDRGFVPAQRQSEVLGIARTAGIDLQPDDFIVHLLEPAVSRGSPATPLAASDEHLPQVAA
jgi:hypothetical protein